MIVKFGTKNLNPKDKDSSKIMTTIEIDKDKEMVKESKLKPKKSK